jgi:large subunit ribosomal protein L31e
MVRKVEKKELQPVARDYTINVSKRVHGMQFKKKSPRAVKEIKKFARVNMLTEVKPQNLP